MKSQVSLFIIGGIFVLIIFSFLFFIQSRDIEDQTEQEIVDTLPTASSFESQFARCVQDKVELGFDMIFKQGGIIYEDQGGQFERPDFDFGEKCINNDSFPMRVCENDKFAINYGVISEIPFVYNISPNYKGSGAYDGFDTTSGGTSTGIFNQENSVPYFGKVTLPKLCNRDGPNAPDTDAKYSCLPQLYNKGKYDKNLTVQSQINRFLEKTIVSCFDDPTLVREFNFDFEGGSSIITTFTEEEVLVKLNYTVIYQKGNKDIELSPTYSFPLRAKKLYTLGYLIAQEETQDIFFNKESDYKDLDICVNGCWDGKLVVSITRDYLGTSDPSLKYDDLITIEERSSEITNYFDPKDEPSEVLTFMYAVQNRRPFLEKIKNQPEDLSMDGYDYGEAFGLGPSTPASDRTINFDFKVLDPDEDSDGIYSGTLGYKSIIKNKDTEYLYYSSPGVIDYSNYNAKLPLSVPSSGGPADISLVLGCTSQCKSGDFQGKPYHPTIYSYKATVSDGQYEDYQEFTITINP